MANCVSACDILNRSTIVTWATAQEAGGSYGAAEYQLTAGGARTRVRLGATDYDQPASMATIEVEQCSAAALYARACATTASVRGGFTRRGLPAT